MEEFFNNRISDFKIQGQYFAKRSGFFTLARILIFILFLALWIFLLYEEWFSEFFISLLVFPFIFGTVVNRHRKVNYKQQFYKHLVLINEEELNRLKFKPSHFNDGVSFMDEAHPYSGDLDIFGPKGVYHFLNRAATPAGEKTLAMWLLSPSKGDEIRKRQQSIAELSEEIEWRQEVQATEMEINYKGSTASFMSWLHNQDTHFFKGLIYFLPVLTLLSGILWLTDVVSFYVLLGFVAINAALIMKYASKTTEITAFTDQGLAILKKYRHIIALIENKDFKSEKLLDIQRIFSDGDYKASSSLKRLERILEFLYARSNMFYHILNFLLLLDLHLIVQAERWRKNNARSVEKRFDGIGELEALSGFAGWHFANKKDLSMPEIAEGEYTYEANSLGHPLISPQERVSNDYHLTGKGSVHIITGSNMSGKSTFLRTVCLNAVLAYAGGPVCAQKMRLSIMEVFTSMRTKDDLEAHVSSFYAELKRIRQLLKLLENNKKPYLFALDEVLKGTNSKDRNTGATALAKQLHDQNCMGMISTHDLELGDLAKEVDGVQNFSFNSEIIGDEIIFDYKIQKGICKSFNASKLMQQMGIALKT